jgi:cysteine synthase A
MPETMSEERRKLMAAYGAELVLTDGTLGMAGAVTRAGELAAEIPGAFIPQQFNNPANPLAHKNTTGPEIWDGTDGKTDIFVASAGTGGTVSGAGRFLKEKNPAIKVIAAEPASFPHKIQGTGAGFEPENLDRGIIDEFIPVADEDAFAAMRGLARLEGVFAGISSGAALWAAAQIAKREENRGKMILTILPDSGERYLSIIS